MKKMFFLSAVLFAAVHHAHCDEKEPQDQVVMSDEKRIEELEADINKLYKELRDLQKKEKKLETDYKFSSAEGDVKLSELFQGKEDLIVIHNMGKGCPYCTAYADGINGVLKHLEDRAAVVLISPDSVEDQKKFAKSRGWGFRMISTAEHGQDFNEAMGFYDKEHDDPWPGYSTYHKKGDEITRVGASYFDPDDKYCVLFPMIMMLKDGVNGWHPKYEYDAPEEAK